MTVATPHISTQRQPVIRQLDEAAINRIAAGEVVERPASAVKELVENAIDADARRIVIDVAHGGKTLIRVSDDGCGMGAEDLPLALSRHATSKTLGDDLLNISSFGFRGEALPSLGSVGRLTITSRAADQANQIRVTGGTQASVKPAARNRGTTVELRDLFYATPARLKFLRTDRAEMQAISDVVKRLAMAEPAIAFTLKDVTQAERICFRVDAETGDLFDALRARLTAIMGRAFTDNALAIDADRDGMRLTGYAALPTYSRGSAVAQFLFVNGRPVRDKLLIGALRAAYMDVLSRDRHPAAVLFIDCPCERVDVNVHPAKSEVRFREPALARSLIVTGLRHALTEAGHRASSTVADATLSAFQTPPRSQSEHAQSPQVPRVYQMDRTGQTRGFAEASAPWSAPSARVNEPAGQSDGPLGAARAQVHETYIIAQTTSGIVLVDQHAAHERLVYEQLKSAMASNGVARQVLLIPEIVTLGSDAEIILEHADALQRLGLVVEAFGPGTVAVRETPALLGEINAEALLRDLLDDLSDLGDSQMLKAKLEAVLSRVACHGSIRSGRQMRADEMNALLREMEATPMSGQCNHGRPTYVELKLSDIERLFGRT